MGVYDRFMQVINEDGVECLIPATREPFKLLVDDEARRAVIERVGRLNPSRGHRNPIKAQDEYESELERAHAQQTHHHIHGHHQNRTRDEAAQTVFS